MPEGHLIHHHARQLGDRLVGRALEASSPQGRFSHDAAAINGCVLDDVEAYGKHLFLGFGDGVVHIHLGRQGTLLWTDAPPPKPRPSVRLRLVASRVGASDLIAPLVCELGARQLRDEVAARLGPDPLREDADVARVRDAWAATGRTIGDVLLDQAVVSGVGNVLRSEALFLAGVGPVMPARHVAFEPLWSILVRMMERAARRGRIVTTTDDEDVPEAEARFVYKQERCRRCGAEIERPVIGGRVMYACPREQSSPPRHPPAKTPAVSPSARRP